MIKSFKHKGLEKFFLSGSKRGIQAQHAPRLRMQLAARKIGDLDIPGYRLHALSGSRKALWSIRVSANWRITFELKAGDVYIVNYEDYH